MFLLEGKVQHYDWGGFSFIPQLLQIENPQHKPFAEYWLGAHPTAPSEIIDPPYRKRLDLWIQQHPLNTLGQRVYERFGQLPYLMKILDVRHMLSIQVHPSLEGAMAGYEREEQAGIPLHAPHRNYKDRNHKPELMVALSDFWLLHGFRPEAELLDVLQQYPPLHPLLSIFTHHGYQGLYSYVMQLNAENADALLRPLVNEAIRKSESAFWSHIPLDPEYWLAQAVRQHPGKHLDKGLFCFFLMNIVHLQPGEAIFQAPGVLHAYLYGQNVEIMANSDNVLRGGLTTKHVDVPELLHHVHTTPINPEIIRPQTTGSTAEEVFPCPASEFQLSRIELAPGRNFKAKAYTTEIWLLLNGHLIVQDSDDILLHTGQSIVLFAGEEMACIAQGETPAILFRATVPIDE